MIRKRNVTLLVDFFDCDYYWAYDEMIEHLRPLLLIPQQNPRLVERLDFRPDLPRGSKSLIYREIARLLQSGSFVLKPQYNKNDLFRWLADTNHSNLGDKFQTVQSSVNKRVTRGF